MTAIGNFVLELSLRSAAAALGIGGILALARVRNSTVCHAAWTSVLCAMLLMPVLTSLTPALPAPFLHPMVMEIPAVLEAAVSEPAKAPSIPFATTPARGLNPAASRADVPWWPMAALAVYGLGTLVLLARMAMGWRAACRLAGAGEPVEIAESGVRVVESGAISAPLTAGVFRPRIVLPRGWTAWPSAKLRAVLAHESAHIRRRDPAIAMLARVNLCLFWFHPLAWWLARRIALTAEQACDEAGARAVGERRAYAEILLEIAETVRRSGGRLAWTGIAMTGAGALERRIDHVLLGDASRRISRARNAAIAAACGAAIFAAAGCRQKAAPEAALTPGKNGRQSVRVNMPPVYFQASLLARALETSPRYDGTAALAQRTLEESKDVGLVLSAATLLVGMQSPDPHSVQAERFLLGKELVQHALELQPDSTWARQVGVMAADRELTARMPHEVLYGPLEQRRRAIESLPEGERFRELAILAMAAGNDGFRAAKFQHDVAEEKAAWQRAGGYAREALALAPKATSHPDYGTAFFNANMVLGMAALKAGDAKSAGGYLLKAAEAPSTEALRYPIPNARPWTSNWRFPDLLTKELQAAGEGDTVARFRERYAHIAAPAR